MIGEFTARDAEFRGIEARLNIALYESEAFNTELSFFGDTVDAEFDQGGNVPRIPASKVGTELEFYGNNWTIHLTATKVYEQENNGELELETDGYELVSIYADYHWDMGQTGELKLFFTKRADFSPF